MAGKKGFISFLLYCLVVFTLILGPAVIKAQVVNPPNTPEQPSTGVEQELENLTENNEDIESEDDSYQPGEFWY